MTDRMRVMVAGTRSFGRAVLRDLLHPALLGAWELVGAIAPPGDVCGQEAARIGLPVHTEATPDAVRGVDLLVCAHTHAYIGRRTRHALNVGAVGYHPSLLPRHRGRDAVRWTIHMGDPVAGGSVYWLSDRIDAGDIAAQQHVLVEPGATVSDLWRESLFPLGVELLRRTVHDVSQGRMVRRPQNEKVATWEPSWDRQPLFRPELIEIGPMPVINGKRLQVVNST